jgi:hypothetical protein
LRPPWRLLRRLPRGGREVDDHLRPLRRADQDLVATDRPRHQAAVAADLDHRRAVGEVEVVGLELGDVEHPQPVSAGLDPVLGHEGAVDEDALAGDAVGGGLQAALERVGQLVVAIEAAVGDHQRDVAIAARQR